MHIFEDNTGRVGGVDMFEGVVHVRLRGLEVLPFRNMHSQGFEGIMIQRMQIFEDNTRRVGGVDLFEGVVHVGL